MFTSFSSPVCEHLGAVCLKPNHQANVQFLHSYIQRLDNVCYLATRDCTLTSIGLDQSIADVILCPHFHGALFSADQECSPHVPALEAGYLPAQINSGNYFHLLLETGFSLFLAKDVGLDIPLILDTQHSNNSLLKELIALFCPARDIVLVDNALHIGKLLAPNFFIINHDTMDSYQNTETWRHAGYSADYFIGLAGLLKLNLQDSHCNNVILVDRLDAKFRKDIRHCLRSSFLGYDNVVAPDTLFGLSLAAQASYFYNAAAIIAIHGASLANLMFCRPGTLVIEILVDSYSPGQFAAISDICKLRYTPIIASAEPTTTVLPPIQQSPDITEDHIAIVKDVLSHLFP